MGELGNFLNNAGPNLVRKTNVFYLYIFSKGLSTKKKHPGFLYKQVINYLLIIQKLHRDSSREGALHDNMKIENVTRIVK